MVNVARVRSSLSEHQCSPLSDNLTPYMGDAPRFSPSTATDGVCVKKLFRGLFFGLLFSVPLWALIALVVWWIVK
jgi:hypothetical protein